MKNAFCFSVILKVIQIAVLSLFARDGSHLVSRATNSVLQFVVAGRGVSLWMTFLPLHLAQRHEKNFNFESCLTRNRIAAASRCQT